MLCYKVVSFVFFWTHCTCKSQGDHSPDNLKFPDNSLTVCVTRHVKRYSYHARTSTKYLYGRKYAANYATSPWQDCFPDISPTFCKIPDISLTAVKIPDISRFSRQVVALKSNANTKHEYRTLMPSMNWYAVYREILSSVVASETVLHPSPDTQSKNRHRHRCLRPELSTYRWKHLRDCQPCSTITLHRRQYIQ